MELSSPSILSGNERRVLSTLSARCEESVKQMMMRVAVLLLSVVQQLPAQSDCHARPGTPTLNHVVIAVSDLESAGTRFVRAGFTVKPGRLHPDRLLNRHVKFRDQTELELITVQGTP